MRDLGPEYARVDDDAFTPRYRASCHCGAVRYDVSADPPDAGDRHCRTCQSLHGAPMQWAAIFHKRHVRLTRGIEHLQFLFRRPRPRERRRCAGESARGARLSLTKAAACGPRFRPCSISESAGELPGSVPADVSIFYGQRVVDMADGLPKWSCTRTLRTDRRLTRPTMGPGVATGARCAITLRRRGREPSWVAAFENARDPPADSAVPLEDNLAIRNKPQLFP